MSQLSIFNVISISPFTLAYNGYSVLWSLQWQLTSSCLLVYHLFIWWNLNFLHISQFITVPTQSCLVLYSLCTNLLHSLIRWLMVSSLSPLNLHLLFCCVLSLLALIRLVLMALFCAAIRRNSVFSLKVSLS